MGCHPRLANGLSVLFALALVASVATSGCVASQTERCGAFRCAKGEECDAIHQVCIKPIQRVLCDGLADGDLCEVDGVPGFHCDQGICIPGRCGDGINDAVEECDDGGNNRDDIPDACRTTCRRPRCGDGIVDPSNREQCDDGDANSDTVPGACRLNCSAARCGDGTLDASELCDDGNAISGDGCAADCQSTEVCGNGVVDFAAGENCDDGNTTPGDGCSAKCVSEYCSNGIVDVDLGEECDDGNPVGGDGCGPTCKLERCGNGFVDIALGEQCDDGNLKSGDGCSSCCTIEVPFWREIPTGFPDARERHVMAYDPGRGKLVLFGGRAGPRFGDTWEHDGLGWSRVESAAAPAARYDSAMVYNAARSKLMLYAGNGGSFEQDTWEYDGDGWTQLSPANDPGPRTGHGMAYDYGTGRVVLFGGLSSGNALGDTWEFDNTTLDWVARSPSASPAARRWTSMVYDANRGRVILFGGDVGATGATSNDMWEFDSAGDLWVEIVPTAVPPARRNGAIVFDTARGVSYMFGGYSQSTGNVNEMWAYDGIANMWTDVTPASGISPSSRRYHAVAYVAADGRTALFGGNSSVGLTNDFWFWDGSAWTEDTALASALPEARKAHRMVYDPGRDRVVLFGGWGASGTLSDTWEFDGASWHQRTPPVSPSPRNTQATAFDTLRGLVVLFSGWQSPNDTWAYDGYTWFQVAAATPPPARSSSAMVYDSARDRFVLFAGDDPSGPNLDDTWEYDPAGGRWDNVTPALSPPARRGHAMAYDADRGVTVLFGGDDSGQFNDTWEYDGATQTWQEMTITGPLPSNRWDHALVYDTAWRRVVLIGGKDSVALGDSWIYDGSGWRQLLAAGTLPPREWHDAVYDRKRSRVVVFGGNSGANLRLQDTQLMRYSSACPIETCDATTDGDGDGLVGCADPDCGPHQNCPESDCGDGVDNDSDGAVDCAEDACFGQACGTGNSCAAGACVTCPTRVGVDRAFLACEVSFSYDYIAGSTGTLALAADEGSAAVSLPFGFNFYGRTYGTVYLHANGALSFVDTTVLPDNACLPSPATNGVPQILGLWDDLTSAAGNGQGVFWEVLGNPGDRRFVAQWLTERAGGSQTVDFQIVLFETGDIELRYQDTLFGTAEDNGASATAGLTFGPAGPDLQYSCNTATLTGGLAIRYYRR